MSPDVNQIAKRIVDEATAQAPPTPQKNAAAVALGRRGGLKGGKARAQSMTPEQRSAAARKAANARWGNLDTDAGLPLPSEWPEIRRLLGWTRHDLARRAGASHGMISNYEREWHVMGVDQKRDGVTPRMRAARISRVLVDALAALGDED